MIKIARMVIDLHRFEDPIIEPQCGWESPAADLSYVIGLEAIIIDTDKPVSVFYSTSVDAQKWSKWKPMETTAGDGVEILKHPEFIGKQIKYRLTNSQSEPCRVFEFQVLTREYAI